MNAKKILSLVLVVALVVCAALAVTNSNKASQLTTQLESAYAKIGELETTAADTSALDALQAQLDEANAKIAELEAAAADTSAADELQAQIDEASAAATELQAQIDLYKPYYDAQVIVAFDGGVIMLDDVLEQYAAYENYYTQMGMDLEAYGLAGQVKQMAAQNLLDTTVLKLKAAELGFDQLDDETMAGLTEQASANFESYVKSVMPTFETKESTEEEVRAASISYLESLGYTEEKMLNDLIDTHVQEKLYNDVTAGVSVDDNDIQAAFDALVAEQQTSFANDSSYNNARNNGEMIAWNPEGYRAVKHVLIKFSDEQSAAMDELEAQLDALNAELEALNAPAEETAEATEETAETTEETAETTEETAQPRTAEEINAEIAAVQAEIDAIYAELMPEAEEVISKFNAGTSFADLIAEHNDDPGMQNEPTASAGYAVAATSTTWDPAFTAGAMSIESVGGISEPVFGMYGIHVLYYESDIPAGPVAIETVSDSLAASALQDKINTTWTEALDSWIEALNPVYSYDNLG